MICFALLRQSLNCRGGILLDLQCVKKKTFVESREGFQNVGGICVDIDECSNDTLNNCNVSSGRSVCNNRDGGFNCACRSGYSGNGTVSVRYGMVSAPCFSKVLKQLTIK